MGAIPQLKRLSREDFKDAPAWFGRFLDLLSTFIGDVSGALGGQLDASNLRKQFEPMTVTTKAVLADSFPLTFKNRLGAAPKKVALVRCIPETLPTSWVGVAAVGVPAWDLTSAGLIRIRYIGGLAVSTKYQLTFEVE